MGFGKYWRDWRRISQGCLRGCWGDIMAICPHCGREVPDDAVVCPYCGAQLNPDYVVCGSCGKLIPADAKVCPYCGVELTDTARCPNCGREMPASSKSCPYCGYRFDKDHPLVRIEYKEQPKVRNKASSYKPIVERKITYTIRPSTSFTPRGYWGMFTFFFLYFGLAMGLFFTFMFSYPNLENFGNMFFEIGIWMFLLSGVLFAIPMAYLFKNVTIIIEHPPDQQLLNQINVSLAELGYHPITEVANVITYKPSLANGLAAGKIILQKENNRIIITGATHYLKKLIKRNGWEPS